MGQATPDLGDERSQSAWAEATAVWSGLRVDRTEFLKRYAWLREEADDGLLHAADLYLVTSCLNGDVNAHQELQQLVEGQLPQLRHLRLSRTEQADLLQSAMTLMLVGANGKPRLAQYSGRGPLGAWLHVVLMRLSFDNLRSRKQALPNGDDVLLGLPDAQDTELELLKAKHRDVFAEAFRLATRALTAKQRNLFRQYYLDDLSLEELASLYRAHRSTVARWLKEAREALLELTRTEIARRTGLSGSDIDSLMKLVRSRIDVSASYFLSTEAESNRGLG